MSSAEQNALRTLLTPPLEQVLAFMEENKEQLLKDHWLVNKDLAEVGHELFFVDCHWIVKSDIGKDLFSVRRFRSRLLSSCYEEARRRHRLVGSRG